MSMVNILPSFFRLSGMTDDINELAMKLTVKPVKDFDKFNVVRLAERPVVLLKRWQADNPMHLLHDELLPLHRTMERLCGGDAQRCYRRYHLVILDDGQPQLMNHLLQLAWEADVLFADDGGFLPKKPHRLLCFDEALVGLDADAAWWNYGYSRSRRPLRGPRNEADALLHPARLETYRNYLARRLAQFHSAFGLDYPDIVFLRSDFRRTVTNMDELKSIAKDEYRRVLGAVNVSVTELDFERHPGEHILRTLSKTRLIVGPHGPHMAATLIMPLNGAILELFPYGIKPADHTFVATMAAIRRLLYSSVATERANASIPYPNRPPKLGGIAHLDREERERILLMTDVGAAAPDDPAYLYRVNQHTIIDADTFRLRLIELLTKMRDSPASPERVQPDFKEWVVPGNVHSFVCKEMSPFRGIQLVWQPPANLGMLVTDPTEIAYDVIATGNKSMADHNLIRASTRRPELTLMDVDLIKVRRLSVWITTLLEGAAYKGRETYYECNLDEEEQEE
jgi:protein O-mannose beta-1,4-N-acetylglucosaminyltransferase